MRQRAEAVGCSSRTVEPTQGRVRKNGGPNANATTSGFSASYGARALGRDPSVEVSSCGVRVREGGVAEEAHAVVVSAFPRHASGAESVDRGMGCVPRTASRTGQRIQDGSTDQSRKFIGPKFKPFQPIGLTDPTPSPSAARRVVVWGSRGVRVGEAENTGPEGTMVDSVGPTRWDTGFALRERLRAKRDGDANGERRAWKLFALLPLMLLHRPKGVGSLGRDELARRVDAFTQGRWKQLIDSDAQQEHAHSSTVSNEGEAERRGRAAQSKIRKGQVSRARQVLTRAALALKTDATFQELQGRRPQE